MKAPAIIYTLEKYFSFLTFTFISGILKFHNNGGRGGYETEAYKKFTFIFQIYTFLPEKKRTIIK